METKGLKGKGRLREGAESYSSLCLGLDSGRECTEPVLVCTDAASWHRVSELSVPFLCMRIPQHFSGALVLDLETAISSALPLGCKL